MKALTVSLKGVLGATWTKTTGLWRLNLRMTAFLLAIWFVVTFVVSYFARELAGITLLGFPLGFYMGAQGAPVIYVLIIWWYARYMNNLDRKYGVEDSEGEG